MKTIAIVCSRTYHKLGLVQGYIRGLDPDTKVISACSTSMEREAIAEARRLGLKTEVILPDYANGGWNSHHIRNKEIASRCDKMMVFWNLKTRDIMDSMMSAAKLGKEVKLHDNDRRRKGPRRGDRVANTLCEYVERDPRIDLSRGPT